MDFNCRNTPVHFAHPCSVPVRPTARGIRNYIYLQFLSFEIMATETAARLGECLDSSFEYCSWCVCVEGYLHEPPITLTTALEHSQVRRHHNHSALLVMPSLTVSLHSTGMAQVARLQFSAAGWALGCE